MRYTVAAVFISVALLCDCAKWFSDIVAKYVSYRTVKKMVTVVLKGNF